MANSNVEMNAATLSSSLEQFEEAETIHVLEKLAACNSKDLRKYFQGFREVCKELNEKKEELEVEEIVYLEGLRELREGIYDIQHSLNAVRENVVAEMSDIKAVIKRFIEDVEARTPEAASSIKHITSMQHQLTYLKFVKNFLELRDDVRRCLRSRKYGEMMEKYRALRKIPDESLEFNDMCGKEYNVRVASLDQFLLAEVKASLLELYARMRFPFENYVEFAQFSKELSTSVEILKCIYMISKYTDKTIDPLDIVLGEFGKRFNFHFYGDRETNKNSNPEWFFTQILDWLSKNMEYFEHYMQNFLDAIGYRLMARDEFLNYLVKCAAKKVATMVRDENFVQNRRLLSHLIDETVIFEKELQEEFGYSEDNTLHVISELCIKNVLDTWFQLEHDTISVCIDEILIDPDTYESRYRGAPDVDPYLVPNFADSFVLLMQSMFERYRAIPDRRLQCRFVVLQILIIDEFHSRIVQISQQMDTPWRTPNPQLMNALWYLRVVLDEWNDIPEFVRLQFYLQTSKKSLVQGIFDESSTLYRHFWRERANNLATSFAEHISDKLWPYAQEKWYACDIAKPVDITPSFSSFLKEVSRLLTWINSNISPDSVLSLYYLTNHEVWSVIDANLISQTPFNYQGATQMLHDITKALIPLMESLYRRPKLRFDLITNEKCISVLNTLRVLALPTPSAILIKEEINEIPEQTLEERLEPFNITGLSRARVLEIFEQRCDINVI